MLKKLIGLSMGTGLFLAAVSPTFAATCTNGTTGSNSWNVCVKVAAKLHRLDTNNSGTVTQAVTTTTKTGGNNSYKNTNAGTSGVVSGAATVTTDKIATLNTNAMTVDMSSAAEVDSASNSVTGSDSVNIAGSVDIKALRVSVNNSGTVTQVVTTDTNTGNNTSHDNTIGGSITSGDATVTQSVTTMMNDNVVNIKL